MLLWQFSSTCIAQCLPGLHPVWTCIFQIRMCKTCWEQDIDVWKDQDLNQLEVWNKDKWCHMSKMPFNGNMAKNSKVIDLKKDVFYWYISCMLCTSINENHWLDATVLQGLRCNKRVVIPSYVLKGLTQNMKLDYKNKFHESIQTTQLLPMFRCKYTWHLI